MEFRIWDKLKKNYEQTYIIMLDSQDGMYIEGCGSVHEKDMKNLIVEYSTGRIYKDYIEYCENDIVSLDNSQAIIKWDEKSSMFYFDVIDENNWCEDWNLQDDLERFEIIGTVHDTPREGE